MKSYIQIDETGSIILNGRVKELNYKQLNGKKVPWAFGLADYPTPAVFKFAMTLQPFEDTRLKELQLAYEEEHDNEDDEGEES
jgi:hypothetical protein